MRNDGHIRLLPLHVANKIAAGEVVERPASVLKELMENALDAGATRIDVTVTAGGRNLVSVRDDGCGMGREDALLSLERQATSKIRDVDDIEHIDTLGFRGEAIPSIASVSRFTLTTRRAADEEATRLVVNAGTLAEVAACGAPPGTCVEVRDLFCNVPARRKFLRAYATEESHIRASFTLHALAHPDVGFALSLDGREVYRFAPHATLEERIHDLFGHDFADVLLPVPELAAPQGVRVHGYIGRPSAGPSLRHDQFVFVNGRPATAPVITYAIREAYPRTRDEARPPLVLFIELPPEQVDVNVHPAKREVRFRRPADVREAVIAALDAALSPATPVPASEVPAAEPIPAAQPSESPLPVSDTPTAVVPPPPVFQTPFTTPDLPFTPSAPHPAPSAPHPAPSAPHPAPSAPYPAPNTTPAPWRWFHFLAQTETGFFLLETDAGLVMLDPRAARARLAYEKLLQNLQNATQPLLVPETVQLPPSESARIRSFLKELSALGFELEEFGTDTWKVDAVPALANGLSAGELLSSVASDIAEAGPRRGGARWRDEIVARGVARSFAGAPVRFTPETAEQLVAALATAQMPYVCPRGKPIMVFMSNRELDRKFGRA